jgi:hypothetical protein
MLLSSACRCVSDGPLATLNLREFLFRDCLEKLHERVKRLTMRRLNLCLESTKPSVSTRMWRLECL